MVDADKLDSILVKAEILAGQEFGENAWFLVQIAADRACAHCQRSDIPEEMEQAVAALMCAIADGGAVKTLKRGDTSVTYAADSVACAMDGLAPWRRLGRVADA